MVICRSASTMFADLHMWWFTDLNHSTFADLQMWCLADLHLTISADKLWWAAYTQLRRRSDVLQRSKRDPEQICINPRLQICKDGDLQICMNPRLQICKCGVLQIWIWPYLQTGGAKLPTRGYDHVVMSCSDSGLIQSNSAFDHVCRSAKYHKCRWIMSRFADSANMVCYPDKYDDCYE